jgi:phenylacetate-CoA ligase
MPLKLFDTILKLKGYPVEQAKITFRELLHATDSCIEEKKQAIVSHHLAHNPFYKNLIALEYRSWDYIPVLTKRELQHPVRSRLSTAYTIENVFTGKTSGSSGHPFTFAKNKYAHAMTWAAFHHAYQQHGINLNSSLQARFYGIPLNGKGKYAELFKDFVSYRERFLVFNMNEQVLDGYISRFRNSKYQYINGYTSSILLLAKHCASKGLVLNQICPTLTNCIVTSEMLFPDDAIFLEKWLGVPVINEYGASEVGLIALQNKRGDFTINKQNLFVEVVNDHNTPVTDGTIGRILVTDLYNLAHPMIRYEIGDSGSIKTLENGTRVLENLQGRTSDIARLPSGRVVPGLTFYYVTKSIISQDAAILEFIVVQKEPALFEIQYVSAVAMSTSQKTSVQQAMDTYLERGLTVVFKQLASLDRSNRGKLKQFMSDLDI